VIATKAGLVVGPNGGYPMQHDGRPSTSARRSMVAGPLGADVVDLYNSTGSIHTCTRRIMGAMADLVTAGKVRSSHSERASMSWTARTQSPGRHGAIGVLPLVTERLHDVVPWCAANNAGFIPYAPWAGLPHGAMGARGRSERLPVDTSAFPAEGDRREPRSH